MKSIHEKIGAIAMYVGLISGLAVWFSSGITGNVIGGNDAVLTGGLLIIAGIAGMLLYTRNKQKSLLPNLPKKGKIKIKNKVPAKRKKKIIRKKKKK